MVTLMVSSCEKIETSELVFKNSFEEMGRWAGKFPTVTAGKGHSGKYYSKLDSVNVYSVTFQDSLSGISEKPLKKVNISAWIYFANPTANGELIFTIWDKTEKPLFTKSMYIQTQVTKVNEWTQVTLSVNMPENMSPSDIIKVYALQHGKEDILVDDFEVAFEN